MSKENENKTASGSKKTLDPEELVDFTAPIDPTGARRDIILGVNGEIIRVERGSTVRVKRKFVEAWTNAERQRGAAIAAMTQAQKGSQNA